jgi:hypothetical protein
MKILKGKYLIEKEDFPCLKIMAKWKGKQIKFLKEFTNVLQIEIK